MESDNGPDDVIDQRNIDFDNQAPGTVRLFPFYRAFISQKVWKSSQFALVFQIRFSVSAKKVGFTAFSARNRLDLHWNRHFCSREGHFVTVSRHSRHFSPICLSFVSAFVRCKSVWNDGNLTTDDSRNRQMSSETDEERELGTLLHSLRWLWHVVFKVTMGLR